MPRAPRVCIEPRCVARIHDQRRIARCDTHGHKNETPWERKNSTYGPKLSPVVIRSVLDRDHHRCYRPYPELCTVVAKQVDHVIPRFKGGTDDLRNLKAICPECHSRKSSLEGVEARKYGRGS